MIHFPIIKILLVGILITTIQNKDEIILSSEIDHDQTLTNDYDYTLTGQTIIKKGVTLQLEPGVILESPDDSEAGTTSLNLEPGAKIVSGNDKNEFDPVLDLP